MNDRTKRNNRIVLLGIFALFFTPLLLAVLMQSSFWPFQGGGTVNAGALVQPPVPLDLDRLDAFTGPDAGTAPTPGQWVILYPFSGVCADQCQAEVTSLRQLHRALGRHQAEVTIVLVSTEPMDATLLNRLRAIYSRFHLVRDRKGMAEDGLAQVLATIGENPRMIDDGRAYLLDPRSHIILTYAAGYRAADIKQDLDRLLK